MTSAAEPMANEKEWRGSGLILVIDDEEAVRTVCQILLEQCGFQVLTAADGRRGVELFAEHAERIVLVLLDKSMPRMSGEQVLHEIRRIRGDIPIILSSGYCEQETSSSAPSLDLAAFIHKPYRPNTLLDKVREVLAASRA